MSMLLSSIILCILATTTIYLGSKLSAEKSSGSAEGGNGEEDEVVELTYLQVLIMPLSASACLLLIFYFFDIMQYVVVISLTIGSFYILYDILYKYIGKLFSLSSQIINLVSILLSGVIFFEWVRTGNFVCHDILGCALCISCISLLRFPSLKLATICLTLLLLYDIFWVFYSERIFDRNVMVDVATKTAANPIHALGKMYGFETWIKPDIDLPIKLVVPSSDGHTSMLGLGDIVLPGLIVSLALRFDCDGGEQHSKDSDEENSNGLLQKSEDEVQPPPKQNLSLFYYALCGYIIGLIAAFSLSYLSSHAQPALIYLVPGVIIPLVCRAHYGSKLSEFWHIGPKSREYNI